MKSEQIQIVMFSGGRGTARITEALIRHGQASLTLLVNTYDDGLSTGALRQFIPGMLGPSDVRKNVSRLINTADPAGLALKTILEYRFPEGIADNDALLILNAVLQEHLPDVTADLRSHFDNLSVHTFRDIKRYLGLFLTYYRNHEKRASFHFNDCSLGNLIFSGVYLNCDRSFNRAIHEFSRLSPLQGAVLNVTDGKNLVLTALKENGIFLGSESDIVKQQDEIPLQDLFLLPDYLSPFEEPHKNVLKSKERFPEPNIEAIHALQSADIIIYGPGTQHSSLFPSYLTKGIAETIAANAKAEKIFIGNIRKDYEILGETASSLIRKFHFYMTSKGQLSIDSSALISTYFLQTSMPSSRTAGKEYVFLDAENFQFKKADLVAINWEEHVGEHSGGQVVDELIFRVNSSLNKRLKPFHHRLSILVPALNEETNVGKVLEGLIKLDISNFSLDKEIILIDGGSSDKTVEIAKDRKEIRVLELPRHSGRGDAIRRGIQESTGNIIAFFPSDNEYRAEDLLMMLEGAIRNSFQVVYGSRAIKCINLSQRILEIYRGNRLLYMLSKYGGMSISIFGLLLYNRFVSDPLTGLKMFDARLLKGLNLSSHGLDFETEILAKLGRIGSFILEVPVEYCPRTREQGKKTTVADGLVALWQLIKLRFFPG